MATITKIATGAAVASSVLTNGSWTNEQNARVATTDLTAGGSGTYATCANVGRNKEFGSLWPFVFSTSDIPDGATINSVSVKVQWKISSTSGNYTLRSTAFDSSNDSTGTALSANPGVTRTGVTADTDDTYSLTTVPSLAQLRSGIWVRASAMQGGTNTSATFSLDYIQVTVNYTPGPTIVALNQASETDTAQSAAVKKVLRRTLAQVNEAHTAQSFIKRKAKALAEVGAVVALAGSYDVSNANNSATLTSEDGQAFTASSSGALTRASFYMSRNTGAGVVTAKLYPAVGVVGSTAVPDDSGPPLAVSASVDVSTIGVSMQKVDFDFDGTFQIQAGSAYCIVVALGGSTGTQLYFDNDGGGSGNRVVFSGSWIASAGQDVVFSVEVFNDTDEALGFTVVSTPSSGHTIALHQASETDTAQSLAHKKTKSTGEATEADIAQNAARKKVRAAAQAAESDTGQSLARRKAKVLGQAAEVDSAQPVAHKKARALGVALEVSTAQPFSTSSAKTIALGQAIDDQVAQALGKEKIGNLGRPAEVDAAQPVEHAKARSLGQPVDAGAAQPLAAAKIKAFGQASGTDAARSLSRAKSVELGQALETDEAQAVSNQAATHVQLGEAAETDTAFSVARAKVRAFGQAQETSSAQRLTLPGRFGQAAESDAAQPMRVARGYALGRAQELSSAHAVAHAKRRTLAQAQEAGLAQVLRRVKVVSLGAVLETDAAQPFTHSRSSALAAAPESNLALALRVVKTKALSLAEEADEALGVVFRGQRMPSFENVYSVPGESRALAVDAEARGYAVRGEAREYAVPAEDRSYAAENEIRTLNSP